MVALDDLVEKLPLADCRRIHQPIDWSSLRADDDLRHVCDELKPIWNELTDRDRVIAYLMAAHCGEIVSCYRDEF